MAIEKIVRVEMHSTNLKCRTCGEAVSQVYDVLGARKKHALTIFTCKSCHAYYTFPQGYDYHESDPSIIEYYEARKTYVLNKHQKIFSYIESAFGIKKARFLDIGSGFGFSLNVAEKRGWQALGVEPCQILANHSKQKLHLNVVNGFYSKEMIAQLSANDTQKFDYILIDNVLEHVNTPLDFIKHAFEMLADNGVMLIAVPPVDWFRLLLTKIDFIRNKVRSAQLNLFYDPEQHINYFSRFAIRQLIQSELKQNLLSNRFHHSSLLNNKLAEFLRFETGYFFVTKSNHFLINQ